MEFCCSQYLLRCLGREEPEGQHEVPPLDYVELALKGLQTAYDTCDTTGIVEMFSTPCVCYITSPSHSFGRAQKTPAEVAYFFWTIRKELQCTRMQFLVQTKLHGVNHEYAWKSDVGTGIATVGWRYCKVGRRREWKIVYLDIQCLDSKTCF
eukprot:TRINITY_DN39844_c0_g1_i1.p1 TRINITY_DN39844_c0_g1~~TRINITY_DN39844_c0_g1_i1.p1  ORF type:complete len:152 (+),score=1.35 TRINITY_DN39844_c0_g1_i1:112-567(+)